jgi:hypothetical protein
MRPKVHLLADAELHFEYVLAKELHKTHRQLLADLGPGELAYWRATFALENDRYEEARKAAEKKAQDERTRQEVLSGINGRTLGTSPG